MKIPDKGIRWSWVGGIFLLSCQSVAQQKPAEQSAAAQPPAMSKKEAAPLSVIKAPAGPAVAPNRCRLIGKVMAISSARDQDSGSVCATFPCKAVVKVQRIIGYGHAFNETLAENQEINTYFTFSLQPTARLFPAMTTPLPGLAIGSVFQADVAHNPEATWYQVGIYQIL